MKRPTISAVVITLNEEDWIEGCLRCLAWVDELVVMDGGSSDRTVSIAKKFADKVYTHKFDNFKNQKNRLLKYVTSDWIIAMDADERSTPEFRRAVLEAIASPKEFIAFEVQTRNIFLGKEMRHGGWYPEFHPRVFKMENFKGWKGEIHEGPVIEGKIGKIEEHYFHLSHRDIASNLQKTIGYSSLESKWRREANFPKVTWWKFFLVMGKEFYRRAIKGLGFRDGMEGWIEIIYQTFSVFITYARLWELQRKESLKDTYRRIDRELVQLNEKDTSK